MAIGRLLILFACLTGSSALGQEPATGWEVRPKVTADIELVPRTRLQIWGESQDGVNFSFQRWRAGALLNRRLRPITRPHKRSIDEESEHFLVFGAGYEYLHTIQNGGSKRESRVIAQATPNYIIGAGFLLTDRNRAEFRWVNGTYDFRYRNKLTIARPVEVDKLKFTPYGSGELYYDRNHHAWNQSQYGFGVQIPYRRRLMVDTYLLHQNCTTCSQNPVNMLGITLNLYYRQTK